METRDNESTGSVHKIKICNYKAANALTLPYISYITDWPLGSQDLKSPLLSHGSSTAQPNPNICAKQFVFLTIK